MNPPCSRKHWSCIWVVQYCNRTKSISDYQQQDNKKGRNRSMPIIMNKDQQPAKAVAERNSRERKGWTDGWTEERKKGIMNKSRKPEWVYIIVTMRKVNTVEARTNEHNEEEKLKEEKMPRRRKLRDRRSSWRQKWETKECTPSSTPTPSSLTAPTFHYHHWLVPFQIDTKRKQDFGKKRERASEGDREQERKGRDKCLFELQYKLGYMYRSVPASQYI